MTFTKIFARRFEKMMVVMLEDIRTIETSRLRRVN